MTGAAKTANARRVKKRDTLGTTRSRIAIAVAAPLAIVTGALIAACAGPPTTSAIEGEPVCPDYEIGAARTKMAGGLRYPVLLVIKSGSNTVFKTTITGRRSEKDAAARFLLSDDNETYTVEWSQCENERASKAAESAGRDQKGMAKYECGTAAPYKTEQLVTKKGDPASHTLHFPEPPNSACWQSVTATPAADAGAPDAAPSADDAGAASPDAGAEITDGGAGDASAPDDAGTTDAGGDAGATDAGSDAGASKAK